ncbi:hypothetical protein LCGC14_2367500, partial [marine sediment metagenome]
MSAPTGKVLLAVTAVAICLSVLPVSAEPFENPKAKKPPRAKPQRRSAAESVPPLPLPATPLRRSERKRQPSPPALVGMITFGGSRFVMQNGKRVAQEVFPTTQIDIERLTGYANQRLGIRYRFVGTSLKSFSWDPVEFPLLYITGWTTMPKLPDEIIAKLRRYLYDGGTLVLHAQCGRAEFYESAKENIMRIFPRRKLAMLDTDSPLFRAYMPLDRVRIRQDDK